MNAHPNEPIDHQQERAGAASGSDLAAMSLLGAARALAQMDDAERVAALTALGPDRAAELLDALPLAQAGDLIAHLDPPAAAALLDALPSDARADLLARLDDNQRQAVLALLPAAEAAEAQRLAAYPPLSAGGLMITEYLAYPLGSTIRSVQDDLTKHADRYHDYDVQYLYVVDRDGALAGVLRMRDVLMTPGERLLDQIAVRHPLAVDAQTGLDELADAFDRSALLGVPIVDDRRRLLGVVRRHDVEQALGDRAGSDYLKSRGIPGGEELRSLPTLLRTRRRLAWLSINILLNLGAAGVIALYQQTLSKVIALAVFLPIISDMSGCAGNQAVAVSTRELALGLARPADVIRVAVSELLMGVMNGLVLGLVVAGIALLWYGNPWLGLVVGGALCINTIVGGVVGGGLPLVLKGMGFDPALAAGPILTTVTDVCGFFFALTFAAALISRLAM